LPMDRRKFLFRTGLAAASVAVACDSNEAPYSSRSGGDEWDALRNQLDLSRDDIHMSAMFVASHPRPVREAIERHRRALEQSPVAYLRAEIGLRENEVLEAAAGYLGARSSDIALTDSTTMGLGLVYNGLSLHAGQEVLTTEQDYYATH
jgi:isopenicillin-N epimerase